MAAWPLLTCDLKPDCGPDNKAHQINMIAFFFYGRALSIHLEKKENIQHFVGWSLEKLNHCCKLFCSYLEKSFHWRDRCGWWCSHMVASQLEVKEQAVVCAKHASGLEHLRSGCTDKWVKTAAESYWLTLKETRLWLAFPSPWQDDGLGCVLEEINAVILHVSICMGEENKKYIWHKSGHCRGNGLLGRQSTKNQASPHHFTRIDPSSRDE